MRFKIAREYEGIILGEFDDLEQARSAAGYEGAKVYYLNPTDAAVYHPGDYLTNNHIRYCEVDYLIMEFGKLPHEPR